MTRSNSGVLIASTVVSAIDSGRGRPDSSKGEPCRLLEIVVVREIPEPLSDSCPYGQCIAGLVSKKRLTIAAHYHTTAKKIPTLGLRQVR